MDIVMPSLGSDMEEGKLVEWLVSVGDEVKKGDIIAVIETQKGAIDMETFDAGVITSLKIQPVTTVPVGAVIATVEPAAEQGTGLQEPGLQEADSQEPGGPQESTLTVPPAQEEHISPQAFASEAGAGDVEAGEIKTGRVKASPVARRLARRDRIDLSSLPGSGPSGAILLRDLPSRDTTASTDSGGMRKAIAAAMEKSKREIPHYYLAQEMDISKALAYLNQINEQRLPDQRVLLLALLLRATASALKKYPQFNGYYQQGAFSASDDVHIGNAISLRSGGLVVPAIHSVDSLNLNETMQAVRDIVQRSRSGHLRSSELSDATVTVTSIGERGADVVMGVIYPPQVAIVGFGKPRKAATVESDAIAIRDRITVSLSADHRVSDGIVGAKFLNALERFLQHPETL